MAFNYRNTEVKQIGQGRQGNQDRNSGVYVNTLYGQDIHENPVPVWTADKSRDPFVAFQDAVNGKIIGLSKSDLLLGSLAVGPPGTGKTNLYNMILSRLLVTLGSNDVVIIFDTKGDYLAEFGSRIPARNRIVIGAGEEYRKDTAYYNIFAEVMPRGNDGRLVYTVDSDTDTMDICEQMFQQMNSEMQPVFPAMAEQVVAGVIIYFMRTYWRSDQSKLNNKELVNFLLGSTNDELMAVFQLDYMKDQRSCINYIGQKSNQTQGVNSYIGSVLRKMFIGPFAEANPAREFSMQGILRSKEAMVVFIEYDLKRGQALSPMYGIMIDRALANALGGRQADRKNVYILLDETLLLPRLLHLSDGLNFGRGQKVSIMAGIQNIQGLIDTYGEAGAKNMLASFQTIFAFKLIDYDTRQFLINRLGENYQNISFSAQQKNVQAQRAGHTVEDWNLLGLKRGETVVTLANEKPFLFTMPKY